MAVDDDGRVGVYNPAAARALGVEVDAVVGRDLASLAAAPPALAALAAILREARRSGRAATRRQIEVPTPAGERTLGYTVSMLGEGGAAAVFLCRGSRAMSANEVTDEGARPRCSMRVRKSGTLTKALVTTDCSRWSWMTTSCSRGR